MHSCRRGITLAASLFSLLVVGVYAQVQRPSTKTPAAILKENDAAVALLLSDGDSSTSLGSGFFIEDGSALVTNYHVIEGAKQVYVKVGDKQIVMTNEVYAFDQTHDLAILKVAPPVPQTVRLGNSTQVSVGAPVVVISNPEGLEKSVTNGLVSGLRHLKEETLFQISAPISHGSSGGPVFDENGQVIGVVVAMLSEGQNLNFAIPVNLVRDLWKYRKETSLASLPKSDLPSDTASVTANLDGAWSATFADSVSSGQLSFTLMQDGSSVRGTYSASLGGGGSVVGSVADNKFSFQLSQTIKDCPGTFTGSADLRANTMMGNYTGADCQGQHLNGTFSMARGASVAQASPASPIPTAATQPEIQYGSAGELKGVSKIFIFGVEPDIGTTC